MPCYYEIYENLNLVKIVFDDVLTTSEMLDVIDKLDQDPRYHDRIDELGDFRTLSEIDFDAATMQKLNDLIYGMYIRSNRSKRIAQIAPYEPGSIVAQAFAMAMAQNPKLDVEIFSSPSDAIKFLARDRPGFEICLSRQSDGLTLRPD